MADEPGPRRTTARDKRAGRLLHETLLGAIANAHWGTDPDEALIDLRARQAALLFLGKAADVYGHRLQGVDDLRDLYLSGALNAWKGGKATVKGGGLLHVQSPGCPIQDTVRSDRTACTFCQSFHREVARWIATDQVRDVFFERVAIGDGDCVMWVHTTPRDHEPPLPPADRPSGPRMP